MAVHGSFGTLTRRWALLGGAATLVAPAAHAADVPTLRFDQLYKSFGVRGLEFSDRLLQLKGQQVSMRGYMAPPLKPESRLFVLTSEPLALCPFCQSDADWPADIVVIYLKGAAAMRSGGDPVAAWGRLEVGSWTDPETGFVSQVRIVDAAFRAA